LNSAWVKLESDSVLTNSLGIALFNELELGISLSYSVSKTGFYEQSGDFILSTDTVINLVLEKNTIGIGESFAGGKFQIWPNPVSDILHYSVPESFINNSVMIMDILGNKIYSGKITRTELSINLKNYSSGVYILRIITADSDMSKLFIKD